MPWWLLLPQVPHVPLFSRAALAIGADATMGVMSAAVFSGAALFLGAAVAHSASQLQMLLCFSES